MTIPKSPGKFTSIYFRWQFRPATWRDHVLIYTTDCDHPYRLILYLKSTWKVSAGYNVNPYHCSIPLPVVHFNTMSNWSPSSLNFSRWVIIPASTHLSPIIVTLFRQATWDAVSSAIPDLSMPVPHQEATMSRRIWPSTLGASNVITCNWWHNGGGEYTSCWRKSLIDPAWPRILNSTSKGTIRRHSMSWALIIWIWRRSSLRTGQADCCKKDVNDAWAHGTKFLCSM